MKQTDSAKVLQPYGGANYEVLLDIPIAEIQPYPGQPRTFFNEEEIQNLANSIKEAGQRDRIKVKRIDGRPYGFELIDGERRLRACKLLGYTTIRAIICPVSSAAEQFVYAVASNFCREGHTPLETARALRIIISDFLKHEASEQDIKQEVVERAARICGKSATWAWQHLGLLRLSEKVQTLIEEKKIPFQVGVALTNLKPQHQLKFADHIMKHDLSPKQALAYVSLTRDKSMLADRGRDRRGVPSGDHRRLLTFVESAAESLDIVLNLPYAKFVAMFRNRSDDDLHKVLTIVSELATNFSELEKTLKEVQAAKRHQTLEAVVASD